MTRKTLRQALEEDRLLCEVHETNVGGDVIISWFEENGEVKLNLEEDNRLDPGRTTLTAGQTPSEEGSGNLCPAEIRLRHNGEIYINGRLAANDVEVVDCLRSFTKYTMSNHKVCVVPGCHQIAAYVSPGHWCEDHWNMWWNWTPKRGSEPDWMPKLNESQNRKRGR